MNVKKRSFSGAISLQFRRLSVNLWIFVTENFLSEKIFSKHIGIFVRVENRDHKNLKNNIIPIALFYMFAVTFWFIYLNEDGFFFLIGVSTKKQFSF